MSTVLARRITLSSNANQKIKTVVVLKPSSTITDRAQILDLAKNKLRIKKPQRLFLNSGRELLGEDLYSMIQSDSVVLVSSGEPFVGTVTPVVDGDSQSDDPPASVFVMADASFVDTEALNQLNRTATLPGMIRVCGYPDLCPGLRFPVGAAFLVKDRVFPELIGGDIGCGMTLYALPTLPLSTNISRVASKLHSLDSAWEGDSLAWLNYNPTATQDTANPTTTASFSNDANIRSHSLQTLGTIGAGNHFAELQTIHSLENNSLFANAFSALCSHQPEGMIYLLVHSGSRSLGKSILDSTISKYSGSNSSSGSGGGGGGSGGISFVEGTPEFMEYMTQHDFACHWARRNRELIALRFLRMVFGKMSDNVPVQGGLESIQELQEWMDSVAVKLIDIHHNNVSSLCCASVGIDDVGDAPVGGGSSRAATAQSGTSTTWVHRKGAAPSTEGIVPIPGSRGDYTYLVSPKGDQVRNAYSLPHGAGRKWTRTKANQLITEKYSKNLDSLTKTAEFGSTVICDDRNLLAEEAPDAYKNIQDVIQDISEYVDCVAIMKPILTYKFRKLE
ncbi:tRNA-splicing ligase [Obelidium mucronatum]|nr:tRNA-splicing ligase [Obelidium mucronatum]